MRGWGKLWALSLAAASVLGLTAAAISYASRILSGHPYSVGFALLYTLPDWYFWALVAPPVVALARRFPIQGPRWPGHGALHVLAGSVIAIAEVAFFTRFELLFVPLEGFPTYLTYYAYTLGLWFHYQFIVYWVIVLASFSFDYYRRFRERETRAAQLETEVVRAQLQALRSQIQPHFLFNTLNTIAMLIRERKIGAATDTVARLGDILRRTLDGSAAQEVPLGEELALIRDYLAIEQERYGERLRARFEISPEATSALVPSMILQPIVENAVRHGISPRTEAGRIEVEASVAGGRLRLRVLDDGPGFGTTTGNGGLHVGLATTRRRLEHLYGGDQRLTLGNAPGGGAAVTVDLPLRVQSSGASR